MRVGGCVAETGNKTNSASIEIVIVLRLIYAIKVFQVYGWVVEFSGY